MFNYWSKLDSIEKFYYIGHHIGDGYVDKSCDRLSIVTSDKDLDWLLKYKETTNINTKLIKTDHRPKVNATSYMVKKACKKCMPYWKEYGFLPKSLHRSLPIWLCDNNIKNISAMMLGLFDADGSLYKRKGRDNQFQFSITKNYNLVSFYFDLLKEELKIESGNIYKTHSPNTYMLMVMRNKDLYKIRDFLYMNKELEPYWLKRKYNKWMVLK